MAAAYDVVTEWWQASAVALTQAMRATELSPVELLDALIARSHAVNPEINAIVYLDEVGARQAARESERRLRAGRPLGPLDGLPLTVKDNLLVKNMPATWGSRLFADFHPDADELPVGRLRDAGAVLLGKTNVPEFTLQGYTDNLLFGPTRNPWNLRLTPGGSSGGAVAAVAAGLAPLAIGTDGGGSTRRPASFTGLVGFKPSTGRIARGNGFPPILYDLEAIGLIARTVSDITLLYSALAGPDSRDRKSLLTGGDDRAPGSLQSLNSQRILYVPRFGDSPVDPGIVASVDAAAQRIAKLGHIVEEGEVPFDFETINENLMTLFCAGLAWLLEKRSWEGKINGSLVQMLEAGRRISGVGYLETLSEVWRFRSEMAAFFQIYDMILTPASAAQPWPAEIAYPPEIAGRSVGPRGHAVFTGFANVAGLPGICLPGQPSHDRLPIGFQLVGRFGSDQELLALAAQYEADHPWADRWPVVS